MSTKSIPRRQVQRAVEPIVKVANLRVTAKDPYTGKRLAVWTGEELVRHARAAHDVLESLRQYGQTLSDSERDFLLSEFLSARMLTLLEAGGIGGLGVGTSADIRAEIVVSPAAAVAS